MVQRAETPSPQQQRDLKRWAGIGIGILVIVVLIVLALNTARSNPAGGEATEAAATDLVIYRVASNSRINARVSANTNAAVVTTLNPGEEVQVMEQVEGQSVNGNRTWYRAIVGDQTVFIHSSLLNETRRTGQEARATRQAPQESQVPQSTAAPDNVLNVPALAQTESVSPFGCNGRDDLSCSDFRDIRQNANMHLAQCGDEDRLDPDGDGLACEMD